MRQCLICGTGLLPGRSAKAVLANRGFFLQIAGALTIPSVVLSFYYSETHATIALLVTALLFLLAGFGLNSLAEKRDLNVREASALLVTAFAAMALISSFPFLYLNSTGGAGMAERVTNAYFEGVSGYTTTGFSFIADESILPRSVQTHRAMIEFVMGIGLVFMLLSFLYPEKSIKGFFETVGRERLGNSSMPRTYFEIASVYALYIAAAVITFYVLGFRGRLMMFAFATHILTGGFTPAPETLARYLACPGAAIIVVTMLAGSVSFVFHNSLLGRRIRKALTAEVFAYFLVILAGALAFLGTSPVWALFNTLSFSSGTGVTSALQMTEQVKVVLIALLFVGGCGFSLAGGIKIFRLVLMVKSVLARYSGGDLDFAETPKSHRKTTDLLVAMLSVLAGMAIVFSAAAVFAVALGIPFVDALFESVSAYSTTGATLGSISAAVPIGLEWLVMALMAVGRLKIIFFMVALFALGMRIGRSLMGGAADGLLAVEIMPSGKGDKTEKAGPQKGTLDDP